MSKVQNLVDRVAVGVSGLVLAGCAQVGGAVQQAGGWIGGLGQNPTVKQGQGAVTGAAGGAVDAGKKVWGTVSGGNSTTGSAPVEKPKTAVEICASNNVTLNFSERPSAEVPYAVRVSPQESFRTENGLARGAMVYLEAQNRQSQFGALGNIFKTATGQNVTAQNYATCVQAVTGVQTPSSCVAAKALVAFNVAGSVPVHGRLNGYERMATKPSIAAQMPTEQGGILNIGYQSTKQDRAQCTRDLAVLAQ